MIERLSLTGCVCVCRQHGDKESKCACFFPLYTSVFAAWVIHREPQSEGENMSWSQSQTLNEAVIFFSLSFPLPRLVSAKIIPLLLKWKAVALGCFCVILIHFGKWIAACPPALCLWAELLIYGPVFDQNRAVRQRWQMLLSDGEIIRGSSRAGWLVRHFECCYLPLLLFWCGCCVWLVKGWFCYANWCLGDFFPFKSQLSSRLDLKSDHRLVLLLWVCCSAHILGV